MMGLFQDIRYAARRLRKSPGFTAVVVATLAVAVGGTTAVFSIVDAVLIRSLPLEDPDRVVELWVRDAEGRELRVPHAVYEAWLERAAGLEGISTYGLRSGELRGGPAPMRISGEVVSANFFEVMGAPPLFGRGFLPREDQADAEPVMVIAHSFWQSALAGDPEILGKALYVDETPYTVVGIADPSFHGPLSRTWKQFWTPHQDERTLRQSLKYGPNLFARLKPGVSRRQAEHELGSVLEALELQPPRRLTAVARPLHEQITGGYQTALTSLLAACLAVLLIACVNLAQLWFVRTERQTPEYAARKALGATTGRLFRQALVESLMLSAAGGLCGILLAHWLSPLLLALAPSNIPRISEAMIDWRAIGAALLVTTAAACVFGGAPAWRLAHSPVANALKKRVGGPGGAAGGRRRSTLLATQVALSAILLVFAALMAQTFLTLLPSAPGFAAEGVSLLTISLREWRYPRREQRLAIMRDLMRQAGAITGVDDAALASHAPFVGNTAFSPYSIGVAPADPSVELPNAHAWSVSPGYFELMRIPLVAGRLFERSNSRGGPDAAIVNQTLARKLDPAGNVLGMTIRLPDRPEQEGGFRIVGVAANTRSTGGHTRIWDQIYLPYGRSNATRTQLIVRSSHQPPRAVGAALFARIREAAPDLPLEPAVTMDQLMWRSVAMKRFQTSLIGVFSAQALLLAAMGIFGTVAYGVARRRRELGIRTALGAPPTRLVRTVVQSAIVAVVIGLAIGLAAAAGLSRLISSQLYGVTPYDTRTYLMAGAAVLALACTAAYIPARRASRIEPMEALRHE